MDPWFERGVWPVTRVSTAQVLVTVRVSVTYTRGSIFYAMHYSRGPKKCAVNGKNAVISIFV